MEISTTATVRSILSRNPKKTLVDHSLTPAGVMLLLYPKDGEYCVLLNKRSNSVEDHKGEISFPGGREDESDQTLLETALRETQEEMGVRPEDVEILGELDDVATNSNYLVSTFVGTIPPSYRFKPNAREVAEVLEIPLTALAGVENLRNEVRIVDRAPVGSPSYAYRGHLIFGATAKILSRFLELLGTASDEKAPRKEKRLRGKENRPE